MMKRLGGVQTDADSDMAHGGPAWRDYIKATYKKA